MPPQSPIQNEVASATPSTPPHLSKKLILVVVGIVVITLFIFAFGGKSHTATGTTDQLQGATVFTSEKGSVTVGTKPQ